MRFASESEEEKFFHSVRERISSLAKKRIKSADYEDVVQETLAILKLKLSRVENEDHLLPFVYQTLRNCIGNYYQKKKTEVKHLSQLEYDELRVAAVNRTSHEWAQLFNKAITILEQDNSRCADLFRAMLVSDERSDLERVLNVSRENVYRTLYRCKERLKEILTSNLNVRLP